MEIYETKRHKSSIIGRHDFIDCLSPGWRRTAQKRTQNNLKHKKLNAGKIYKFQTQTVLAI